MTSSVSTSFDGEDIDLNVIRNNSNGSNDGGSQKFCRSYNKWSPVEEGATIIWRDLSVHVASNNKKELPFKTIISNVTGAVKPGSLVALIGGSGAGKSTIMKALAYKTSKNLVIEGDILINGRPIGNYMKYLSGFMHQDDLFVESLTVWEHMSFMARMKLDRRTTKQQRDAKILDILTQLGLVHCLNKRIGSIGDKKVLSGGEKKRLAFASELLTDPQILFCDEPTTGLDSFSAQKLIQIMNEMACNGRTIICTIHQPSSQIFAMFSQIILLADGKIAFMGSTQSAIDFFDTMGYKCPKNYNPADFFIRTLAITPGYEETSKLTVKKICNHFSVSDYAKEVDVVVQYEFHMGTASEHSNYYIRKEFKEIFRWTKFSYLIYRFSLDILRNPAVQTLRIIQKIAIAVMVGLCYIETSPLTQNGIQSIQGALVVVVCENTFPAMYSLLAEFPSSIPLMLREYKSGMYSPLTFYLAKISAMIPGVTIEPILFVTIIYWLCGMRATLYSFSISTLTGALIMNVSCSCGIFFSNAFDSVHSAMLWLIPFDYILMITSGFYANLTSLGKHISWTKYVSWLMYGMESLSIVQWENVDNITCENPNPDLPCLRKGSQVLEKYSFEEGNLNRDLCTMFMLFLGFHFFAFLFFLRKINKS